MSSLGHSVRYRPFRPLDSCLVRRRSWKWNVECFAPLVRSVVNTLRPRQNGRHFPDDDFKRIFFCRLLRGKLSYLATPTLSSLVAPESVFMKTSNDNYRGFFLIVFKTLDLNHNFAKAGGRLNINMSSYEYRHPLWKIRRSRDRLIVNMGIPIPGKGGFYTETGPRFPLVNSTVDRHILICNEMLHLVGTRPNGTAKPDYPTQSIPGQLMTWRR